MAVSPELNADPQSLHHQIKTLLILMHHYCQTLLQMINQNLLTANLTVLLKLLQLTLHHRYNLVTPRELQNHQIVTCDI